MKQCRRGRPSCRRIIDDPPEYRLFKPTGVRARFLEEVRLTFDELEALRLADALGMYQDEAAERMGVSRATFGRIVESARKKTAEALVYGKSLRIEGGKIMNRTQMSGGPGGRCICPGCESTVAHQAGIPCRETKCPSCGKRMLREGSEHHNALKEKKSNKTDPNTGEPS